MGGLFFSPALREVHDGEVRVRELTGDRVDGVRHVEALPDREVVPAPGEGGEVGDVVARRRRLDRAALDAQLGLGLLEALETGLVERAVVELADVADQPDLQAGRRPPPWSLPRPRCRRRLHTRRRPGRRSPAPPPVPPASSSVALSFGLPRYAVSLAAHPGPMFPCGPYTASRPSGDTAVRQHRARGASGGGVIGPPRPARSRAEQVRARSIRSGSPRRTRPDRPPMWASSSACSSASTCPAVHGVPGRDPQDHAGRGAHRLVLARAPGAEPARGHADRQGVHPLHDPAAPARTSSTWAPPGSGASGSPPCARTIRRQRSMARPSRSASARVGVDAGQLEHLARQRQRHLDDVGRAAAGAAPPPTPAPRARCRPCGPGGCPCR